jgi:hypothetical protein
VRHGVDIWDQCRIIYGKVLAFFMKRHGGGKNSAPRHQSPESDCANLGWLFRATYTGYWPDYTLLKKHSLGRSRRVNGGKTIIPASLQANYRPGSLDGPISGYRMDVIGTAIIAESFTFRRHKAQKTRRKQEGSSRAPESTRNLYWWTNVGRLTAGNTAPNYRVLCRV